VLCGAVSGQDLKLKKGDQRVLVVPRVVVTQSKSQFGIDQNIDLDMSGSTLTVGGRTDWRESGLPAMTPLTVFDITKNRGTPPTFFVAFKGGPGSPALLFVHQPRTVVDMQAALDQIATDPTTAQRAFENAVNRMKGSLTGAPLSLPDDVASLVLKSVADHSWNAASAEAFKGSNYLVIDCGFTSAIYNDLQVHDTSGRASNLIKGQFSADLKLLGALMTKLPANAGGIKLTYGVGHCDFVGCRKVDHELIAVYAPVSEIQKFLSLDISLQDLIKKLIVVANGDRIDVTY
jgi:hypothetical protein